MSEDLQAKIGNIPANKFLNRRIRIRYPDKEGTQILHGRLTQLTGYRAVVRVDNASTDLITTTDCILPWWDQNEDLKSLDDMAIIEQQKQNYAYNLQIVGAESLQPEWVKVDPD